MYIGDLPRGQVCIILSYWKERGTDSDARGSCTADITTDDVAGKKSRLLTAPLFKREKEKSLVRDKRPAKCNAVLSPGIRCFFVRIVIDDRGKSVAGLKALVPDKSKNIAVKVACSAL